MKNVFFFLLVILCVCFFQKGLKAQYHYCDSLRVSGTHLPFDTTNIRTTQDYISLAHFKMKRHISNRSKLEAIPLWLNVDSVVVFNDGKINIRMVIGQKRVDPKEYFDIREEGDNSTVFIVSDPPFGITPWDSAIHYIKRIEINGVTVPDEAFSDLWNPNLYTTVFSIKPVQAFKDVNENIHIYVFGELDTRSIDIGLSYMAKLVFTSKGYYIGRIVETGEVLSYFGYGDCPYFIGF